MRVRDKAGRTGQSKAREREKGSVVSVRPQPPLLSLFFSRPAREERASFSSVRIDTVVEEEAHGDFTRSRRLDAARLPVWLPEFWPALRVPLGQILEVLQHDMIATIEEICPAR